MAIAVQSHVPTQSRAIGKQKFFLSPVERRDIVSLFERDVAGYRLRCGRLVTASPFVSP
jgi:hypothetical protein